MTLIKSISGIRGTIGGSPGDSLTPLDVVKFSTGYGAWLKSQHEGERIKVVIGRDARISGPMVSSLVVGTLQGLGIDVVDLGLSTTPTVEVAVPMEGAQGGIILTASHNPIQWNALKLLNYKGEFISAEDGAQVLAMAENNQIDYAEVLDLGNYETKSGYFERHIHAILDLDMVEVEPIKKRNFKVVVDAVNSTGGIVIPMLLKALGVNDVVNLFGEPTGHFPHNPEPLPEHLEDISKAVVSHKADLGIVVDPDVDRLAFVNEDGTLFGEEYTLVAVADYVMRFRKGPAVSNLSSTRALRDVAEANGNQYFASAVGEVNVVNKMKEVGAVIGGEGNGGVILPELHYGRDALVGIALFLTHLSKQGEGMKMTELRNTYNDYHISKNKISLTPEVDVDKVLQTMEEQYHDHEYSTIDGLKIEMGEEWVHLRKSNTEPIIRIYAESESRDKANSLTEKIIKEIEAVTK